MIRICTGIATLALGLVATAAGAQPASKTVTVDCAAGGSIATTLSTETAHKLKIKVKGTCNEDVEIFRAGVELVGKGGATINGRVSVVRGFRTLAPVVSPEFLEFTQLAKLNIVNGGLEVNVGAAVLATSLKVKNSGGVGVSVTESSFLRLINSSVTGSSEIGIRATSGSTLELAGTVAVRNSGASGIVVERSASLLGGDSSDDVLKAVLSLTDNKGFGLFIGRNASAVFPAEDGQTRQVTALRNGPDVGFGVGALVMEGGSLHSDVPMNFSQNKGAGLSVDENGVVKSSALVKANSNGTFGVFVADGARADLRGGLTATNNALGLDVLNASATVSGGSANALTGNSTADVRLRFGGRGNFFSADASKIGTVSCDGTHLVLPDDGSICPP